MASAGTSTIVRRGFLHVAGRAVHYRAAGQGPPALFVHSSPTNGSFVLDDLLALADTHTGIAFDTPGFGLSDPLDGEHLTVADLADATAAALSELSLPPLPVYGTHTGAAVALALAHRHPHRVTGVVLDGVPVFRPEEAAAQIADGYFAVPRPDPLGGHWAAIWTRLRDQSIWFPWFARRPENLLERAPYPTADLHRWTSMYWDAAEHYAPAYRAAITWCDGALEAAAGLAVPAVFTAPQHDMLHPHLRRLPPLRPGQEIVELGADRVARLPLTRAAFARFGGHDAAVAFPAGLTPGAGLRRQIVMDGADARLVRYAGDPADPPLLLLHDLPGSSALIEDAIRAQAAAGHFVVAPDLPGSGESDPLPAEAALRDYADALARTWDALGLGVPHVQGSGLGAAVAVEVAATRPVRSLTVTDLPAGLPADLRADLHADLHADRYAPPVEIRADGGHWYALWSQLRDSLIRTPWYATAPGALRRTPADLGAGRLHRWTVEVMKQHASYHHAVHAALREDTPARLAGVRAGAVT